MARAASAALRLDTVLFAPVGAQPLKPHGSIASFEDRVAMTRLAIAAEPGFAVSLADAPKPSGAPNYTLETLHGLRTELPPDAVLFCLMGSDSFFLLRQWHRAAEIPFVAPLIVASRPGQPLDSLMDGLPKGLTLESFPETCQTLAGVELCSFRLLNSAGDRTPFYILPGVNVEISASQIRDLLGAPPGSSAAQQAFLPSAVLDYIRANGLYR